MSFFTSTEFLSRAADLYSTDQLQKKYMVRKPISNYGKCRKARCYGAAQKTLTKIATS